MKKSKMKKKKESLKITAKKGKDFILKIITALIIEWVKYKFGG